MQIEQVLNSIKALNKAFLKVEPNRTQIEGFKENHIELLDRTNDTESEEFHKNLIINFLKKTYYEINHFIITVKAEIGQLGYRFYGFTEEEIGIVEKI